MALSPFKEIKSPYVEKVFWADYPEQQNLDAARDYLSLLCSPKKCNDLLLRLEEAEWVSYHHPIQILNASGLNLAHVDDIEVRIQIRGIRQQQKLSPILVVRSRDNSRIHIADGYHRLCASYYLKSDQKVPVIITAWESD